MQCTALKKQTNKKTWTNEIFYYYSQGSRTGGLGEICVQSVIVCSSRTIMGQDSPRYSTPEIIPAKAIDTIYIVSM